MLVDRCPGCNKPVAEADNACPHCDRDFTVAVARKPVAAPPPDRDPEPDLAEGRDAEEEAPRPAAKRPTDPPAPKFEKKAAEKAAPKARPRLEERDDLPPSRDLDPVPTPGGFEIDNPQAYVPGGDRPQEDSYAVKKAPARPAWHWLAMAVVCIVAFKVLNPKRPILPVPAEPPKAAPAGPPPQPAAPVQVPGDILGAAKALSDAKDAAAAANVAAAAPPPSLAQPAKAPKPPKTPRRQPHRETPEPVEPEDVDHAPEDSSISITSAGAEEAPRRRGGATASKEWRMRGHIYDLISGEPVKNADVVFMDAKTARRFATGSDAQGLYRATLPVAPEGYDLGIRHPKYEPKYFEDGVPPYRQLDMERRQSTAADLMRVLQTKEMIVGEGGSVLERDYVLIPVDRP